MSESRKFLVRQNAAETGLWSKGYFYLDNYWWGIGDDIKTRWTCSANEAFRFDTLKAEIRFCINYKKAENIRVQIARVKEE